MNSFKLSGNRNGKNQLKTKVKIKKKKTKIKNITNTRENFFSMNKKIKTTKNKMYRKKKSRT